MVLTAGSVASSATPAYAKPPCGSWTSVAVSSGSCIIGDAASNAVSSGIQAAKDSIFDSAANAIVDGVEWVSNAITGNLQAAGTPDLTANWFHGVFQTTTSIGAMFALIALLSNSIYAALTRDGRVLGRGLTRVLNAGVSTGMIGALVAMANAFTDYISNLMLGPSGWQQISDALHHVADLLKNSMTNNGSPDPNTVELPAVIVMILGLFMIISLGIVWCEIIIRRISVDLCVAFWPLASSGSIWAKAHLWQARLVDTLITVLLAKPVIVIVLVMAASQMKTANSASALVAAAGLYALAAMAPYLVMQMIGLIGGATQPGAHGGGMRAGATAGMVGVGATAAAAAGKIARMAAMGSGGRTPVPSAAGQAAAGQKATPGNGGFGFGGGRPALPGGPQRPILPGGRGGAPANGGALPPGPGHNRPPLEGRVIPGQLTASPNRLALPPGNSGGNNNTPPSPTPSTTPPAPSGGHKYAPPAPSGKPTPSPPPTAPLNPPPARRPDYNGRP